MFFGHEVIVRRTKAYNAAKGAEDARYTIKRFVTVQIMFETQAPGKKEQREPPPLARAI